MGATPFPLGKYFGGLVLKNEKLFKFKWLLSVLSDCYYSSQYPSSMKYWSGTLTGKFFDPLFWVCE